MTTILLAAFPLAMVWALATDLATMTISNRLVVGLGVVFLPFAMLAGWPASAIALHAATGLAMLAITLGCFAAGWMGGGDAKLIAATAIWIGPGADLLTYVILASLFGGVLTLAMLLVRAVVRPATGVASLDRLLRPGGGIPYGVALGASGLAVFAQAPWSAPLREMFGL